MWWISGVPGTYSGLFLITDTGFRFFRYFVPWSASWHDWCAPQLHSSRAPENQSEIKLCVIKMWVRVPQAHKDSKMHPKCTTSNESCRSSTAFLKHDRVARNNWLTKITLSKSLQKKTTMCCAISLWKTQKCPPKCRASNESCRPSTTFLKHDHGARSSYWLTKITMSKVCKKEKRKTTMCCVTPFISSCFYKHPKSSRWFIGTILFFRELMSWRCRTA